MSNEQQTPIATASTSGVTPSSGAQAAPAAGPTKSLSPAEQSALRDEVIEALRTCYDPEIPVNIYELGLVYDVEISVSGEVHIRMTLTTPNCPAAISLPGEVEWKSRDVPGVAGVKVEVVWDPPWDPSKMTEAARLQLGMF
jgi:FeS assembly SUF system protein